MSATMWAAQKAGLLGEMPPRKIARAALDASRAPRTEAAERAGGAWWAAGAAWGLVVWATGYIGVMPAASLMPPPPRDRPGRQPAMVVAHLVYGLTLARLLRASRA